MGRAELLKKIEAFISGATKEEAMKLYAGILIRFYDSFSGEELSKLCKDCKGSENDIIRNPSKGKVIEEIGNLQVVVLNIGTEEEPLPVYRAFLPNGVLMFIDRDLQLFRQRCLDYANTDGKKVMVSYKYATVNADNSVETKSNIPSDIQKERNSKKDARIGDFSAIKFLISIGWFDETKVLTKEDCEKYESKIGNLSTFVEDVKQGKTVSGIHERILEELGYTYYCGETVNRDSEKAFAYFEAAYDIYSSAASTVNLGVCYFDGLGVEIDYEKAFKYLHAITLLDSKIANFSIPLVFICYYHGLGVREYKREAIGLLKNLYDSVDDSTDSTQCNLLYQVGCLFTAGEVIEPNCKVAEKFFKKASVENISAMHRLANWYQYGHDSIEPNPNEMFKLLLRAAEKGSVLGMLNVAYCYDKGIGVEASDEKSFEWNLKAANKGSLNAATILSNCYRVGKGVKQDIQKSIEWDRKASEQANLR